jgi:hypothetical protein
VPLSRTRLLVAAWRQYDLHAGVDIEGLGHRLVHLIDRKFVRDEPVQRIGGLECVQETPAARVAGRGMVIPQRRIGLPADACAGGFAIVHENVNPAAGFKDSRLSFSVVE